MHLRLLAIVGLIFTSPCWAQTQSNAMEAAVLGVIEKFYDNDDVLYRKSLSERGRTKRDVDLILASAYEKLATCLVRAAEAQAREQGLPVDVVLRGISEEIITDEADTKTMSQLDWNSLNEKQAPCSRKFDNEIKLAVKKSDQSHRKSAVSD